MHKELLQALDELCQYFDEPIYMVGGAVRNYLMGYAIDDVDLSANISPDKIKEALVNSEFQVKDGSKKLFTLLISKDKYCFEFTSFRIDSYKEGFHRPYECKLVADIKLDALRRDFSINAIYYDIRNRQFVDPLSGMEDIQKRIIRTVSTPQQVFSQDGLRLMRLSRIAAELDLDIETETFNSAKLNAYLIKDIVPERVRDELNKIIIADSKYGKRTAHLKGLLLLEKLGVLNYILPELMRCKGIKQRSDYHKYDVYNHSLKAFEVAPSKVRLAALFHDIGKPHSIHDDGSMTGHDKVSAELTREIMKRLRYAQKDINFTVKLISLHMYDLKCQAKQSTVRKFIQENIDIIDSLIQLKKADYIASGKTQNKSNSGQRLQEELDLMKKENIPFSIKDLKVTGADLISLSIAEEKRGIVLKDLLKATVVGGDILKRECQLRFIKQKVTHKV